MRSLVLRLVAAASLLTGGVLVLSSGPAAAVDAEYGWWSIANAPGGLPVAAPAAAPGAPTDGIYASVGPTIPGVTGPVPDVVGGQVPGAFAPIAVGAIRFPADATSSAVLTLEVTASSTPPDQISGQLTSAVLACPISDSSWTPVQNGPFDKRPAFDCGGVASVGAFSADGKQVTWELSPIFQSPVSLYDVAIVALGQSPFFVSFAAPSATSITVSPPEDTGPSTDAPVADLAPSDAGALPDGTVLVAPDAGAVDTGLPAADAGAVGVDAVVDNVIPPPSAAGPAVPLSGSPRLAGTVPKGRDAWRLFFGVVLVLIGGGLFWTAGQNARAPRLIGPLHDGDAPPEADDVDLAGVRGIGRYARERVGTPRRLR